MVSWKLPLHYSQAPVHKQCHLYWTPYQSLPRLMPHGRPKSLEAALQTTLLTNTIRTTDPRANKPFLTPTGHPTLL